MFFCNYMYLAVPIVGVATAMGPLVDCHHCSPYDAATAKSEIGQVEGFRISPVVATLHDGSGTTPKMIKRKHIRYSELAQ